MSGERALVNKTAMFSGERAVLIKQYSTAIISRTLFWFSLMAAVLYYVPDK